MSPVQRLVEEFTSRLAALVERQTLERAREAVESALGGPGRGRPSNLSALALGGKPRKKLPKQLCPVPGCENVAAPVFGMVCAEHKGVAKAKIKEYREARRAAKVGTKSAPSPGKGAVPGRNAGKAQKVTKRPRKVVARRKAPKKSPPEAAPPTATAQAAPAAA